MAWLAELAPITGARWSCGAYWAEDGSPQASDTDWEDAATWPAAHAYDPDGALSLGVFVGGHDRTDDVQGASWGLGQSEPLASTIQASSGSLQLLAAAADLVSVGDRVCILTEWDVLWSARVEGVAEVETPERSVVSVTATDDLARAALADAAGRVWGGDVMGALDTMMLAAGIVGRAYTTTPDDHTPPTYHPDPGQPVPSTWPNLFSAARTGSITSALSAAAYYLGWLAAYTPSGLRLSWIAREHDRDYPSPIQDLTAFRSLARRYGIESVRNLLEQTGWGVAPLTDTLADTDSQVAYGVRKLSADGSDWFAAATSSSAPLEWALSGFSGDALDFFEPVLRLTADAAVTATRHTVARYMPFDYLTDGDPDVAETVERYRILRVQHRVSPDAWSVTLEGLAVSSSDAPSAAGGLGLMGLGTEGLGT